MPEHLDKLHDGEHEERMMTDAQEMMTDGVHMGEEDDEDDEMDD